MTGIYFLLGMLDVDVVVVGGGLSGAITALSSASFGFSVCVVDKSEAPLKTGVCFDGRSYAVAHSSMRMLRNLGIWQDLQQTSEPILDIKISNGLLGEVPSPFNLHFDHHDLEEGPMGYMVEDKNLRSSLRTHICKNGNITYLDQTAIEKCDINTSGIKLFLKGEVNKLEAQLVISADGRKSSFAKGFGISYIGWEYAQTALVCALCHEKPHNGVAYQHFMPPGPIAVLPLKGNRSSIVWTETPPNGLYMMGLTDHAYLDVLRSRLGNFLGEIKLNGQRFSYPLEMSIAKSLVADRLALVGDAAHGMHPIAGQGLNAGLRDIAALSQVIKEGRDRGEDFGSEGVLNRYQEWRRFDATALPLTLDGLNKIFSNDNQFLSSFRNLGLGLVNGTPSLKRLLMREAAGLSGRLPELMC